MRSSASWNAGAPPGVVRKVPSIAAIRPAARVCSWDEVAARIGTDSRATTAPPRCGRRTTDSVMRRSASILVWGAMSAAASKGAASAAAERAAFAAPGVCSGSATATLGARAGAAGAVAGSRVTTSGVRTQSDATRRKSSTPSVRMRA